MISPLNVYQRMFMAQVLFSIARTLVSPLWGNCSTNHCTWQAATGGSSNFSHESRCPLTNYSMAGFPSFVDMALLKRVLTIPGMCVSQNTLSDRFSHCHNRLERADIAFAFLQTVCQCLDTATAIPSRNANEEHKVSEHRFG